MACQSASRKGSGPKKIELSKSYYDSKFIKRLAMYTIVLITHTTNGNAYGWKFGQKVFFQKSQKFSSLGGLTYLPPPDMT